MKKGNTFPVKFGFVVLLPIFFMISNSFTLYQNIDVQDQKSKTEICKKESMLSVLESLEEGKEYEKPLEWKGRLYFDLSDFNIDEEFFNSLTERMEELGVEIEKRIEELMKNLDPLENKKPF